MFNPRLIWKKKFVTVLKKKTPIVLIKKKHCSSSPQPQKSKLSLHQRRSHQNPRRQILLKKAAPYATDRSHQRRLYRTTPDAATHNTHHSQHRFGFTAAKSVPQPVSSSSAPATAHSTIVAPPPLATDRVVESTGGNHHLQQTAVVLAFSSHACAASNNTQGDGEEGNSSL